MKIKPIIFNRIETRHTSFYVDLQLETNITFINGDAGVGKSVLYSFLVEMSAEDSRIKCFNYLDNNKRFITSIKNSKNKLFIIRQES